MSTSPPRALRTAPTDGAASEESDASSTIAEGRLILDWSDQADVLAWAIANERTKLADRWFAQHGYPRPTIEWGFRVEDVGDPQLQAVFDHWRASIDRHPTPTYRRIALSFHEINGSLASLLEAIEDGRDFRYVRFAPTVAQTEGRDWTGRRLSEFAVQSYRGVFYLALYRVMIQRRTPCLLRHQTDDHRPGSAFRRLLAPLGDDEGRVIGFLNANSYDLPAPGS